MPGLIKFYDKSIAVSVSCVTPGSGVFVSSANRSKPPVAQNKTSAINNAIKTLFIEMIPQLIPLCLYSIRRKVVANSSIKSFDKIRRIKKS